MHTSRKETFQGYELSSTQPMFCISLANRMPMKYSCLMDITQIALTRVGWKASVNLRANFISTKMNVRHRKSTQAQARPGASLGAACCLAKFLVRLGWSGLYNDYSLFDGANWLLNIAKVQRCKWNHLVFWLASIAHLLYRVNVTLFNSRFLLDDF